MNLYGREWTRREIEARAGRIEQIGGVRRYRLEDGLEKDVEQIQVRTAGGLAYHVTPHRGLDVSLAEFRGAPLSWQSPNGDTHPSYFRAEGTDWLRTAAGGLLMTCGMRQVGSPCEDKGESLGIHGRLHHLPARHVSAAGSWEGDDYFVRIEGTLHEARIFGENLTLHRSIWSRLGENRLSILDEVENIGFEESPLMMLYHFNFGFPLVSEFARFRFPSKKVQPREKETPLEGYNAWQAPAPGYAERVYYHSELQSSWDSERQRELAEARIENDAFPGGPVAVSLRWDTVTLPRLVQWKMPGAGVHVMGIEPANCFVGGRVAEREAGRLQHIEPGEKVEFYLDLTVETT